MGVGDVFYVDVFEQLGERGMFFVGHGGMEGWCTWEMLVGIFWIVRMRFVVDGGKVLMLFGY